MKRNKPFQRDVAARGEALGDDLDQATGTSLGKGAELDRLARSARLPLAWRHAPA